MRRPRRVEYALRRLRENRVLQATAALSFMCYGGLIALVLSGQLPFVFAGTIAMISLLTWVFLFWWFPILEQTIRATARMPGKAWIGRSLEAFAIGCAALAHVLMAVMIVVRART